MFSEEIFPGCHRAFIERYVSRTISDYLLLLIVKTSREVELLARLSHPHVVRYYDNWLELREARSVANGDAGVCGTILHLAPVLI